MFPEGLTKGYRNFMGDRLPKEREKYETLSEGQSPEILLISCCDSRVAPEVIFDVGPGEIFTIRNVAAIVPPYESGGEYHGTSSAVEFAVQSLEVKHIVVLGHATCGGIKAHATGAGPLSKGNFIGKWVSLVQPATDKLKAEGDDPEKEGYLTRLEHAMVAQSLENLLTFEFVRERVESGKLKLHGAHFGIKTGDLKVRNPESGKFESVNESAGKPLSPGALMACSNA